MRLVDFGSEHILPLPDEAKTLYIYYRTKKKRIKKKCLKKSRLLRLQKEIEKYINLKGIDNHE